MTAWHLPTFSVSWVFHGRELLSLFQGLSKFLHQQREDGHIDSKPISDEALHEQRLQNRLGVHTKFLEIIHCGYIQQDKNQKLSLAVQS